MKEISMHILDIVMNSIKAEASLIELFIEDSIKNNWLKIVIKDNGIGMTDEMVKQVTDPFFTTRTTRRVGLGIPMLKENCEMCNGYLKIKSVLHEGTTIECCFERDNIDRVPLGNMGDTIITIINSLKNCELLYKHSTDGNSFTLSTEEIRFILDGGSINENAVLIWIKEYVNENIESILNI
ncbi:MAG: hydE [Sedimentibacter sp.]|nr:hydE [Sedimentibacter sp.]